MDDGGGYAIAGYSGSPGYKDFFIVKLNSSGTLVWDLQLGLTYDDIAYSICKTNDNGFAVVGSTRGGGLGNNDLLLIKLSALGEFI